MPKIIPESVWKDVDWSLTAPQIAKQLGLKPDTVRMYAKEKRIAMVDGHEWWAKKQAACGARWKSVDWKKRDYLIARELGVSRQRVWQMRRQLGKLPGQVRE